MDGRLDLARMRSDRQARLALEMERQGVEAALLFATGNVKYATGARLPAADASHFLERRPAALVVRGEPLPFLFTAHAEGGPPELGEDRVLRPLDWESASGATNLARKLEELLGRRARGPIAVDDLGVTMALELSRRHSVELVDAASVLSPAKLCKTADEIECIRRAQQINERAMRDAQAALRVGMRASDLSAVFLRRLLELGATSNNIDPIWQVMPLRRADGPFTTNGEVAFPACVPTRRLEQGDLLWVDTGIEYAGYQSDFGRTWIVDKAPTPQQHAQARRWREVVDAVLEAVRPGATGRDLTRRAMEANGGEKPWLDHFYLIHGVGTDPAEMPLIGTDLGEAFDESIVLAPGMVLVLEPVIWEEGAGGYRSEEIVAVTEAGWTALSDYPYAPFEVGGPK